MAGLPALPTDSDLDGPRRSRTRYPHVKAAEAKAFSDWIVSADGQRTIAAFKVNGEQLFFPDAE
jgi:ABC-type tungstate transport system permease subunit